MSQSNFDTVQETTDSGAAKSAASNNLTWAIGMVLVIAAIAIAIVYVVQNVFVK